MNEVKRYKVLKSYWRYIWRTMAQVIYFDGNRFSFSKSALTLRFEHSEGILSFFFSHLINADVEDIEDTWWDKTFNKLRSKYILSWQQNVYASIYLTK